MDREEFFADQVVDPHDLTSLEDAIENALGRVLADHLAAAGGGVLSGLLPTQVAGPSPQVQVSPGIAYDGSNPARRVSVPVPAVVDLSQDLNGQSTAVGSSGARWVTLTVRQDRNRYDYRLRSDGVQVPFRNDESFAFEVFAGPVASSAAQAQTPSVPATNVILADWLFTASAGLPLDTQRSFGRRVPSSALALKLSVRDAISQLSAITQTNCLVVADSPWSMNVRVLAGRVNIVTQSFTIAGGPVGPLTAPKTNPKIVLIYVDPSSGTVQFVDGAETANPVPPSHMVGVALAQVLLKPGDTLVDESRITDVRPFLGLANLRGDLQVTSLKAFQDANNYFAVLPTTAQLVAGGAVIAQLDTGQLALEQHFIELTELGAAPAAPAAGRLRTYARSNGLAAGQIPPARRTQYVIRWADGSDTVIAEGPAT
jgi:hypothetical protein